ncbi:hypothetical protein PV458_27125 [Streptomyces sp. MN03-5084-2B]|nr:hypothetical protein [Streptomyces sp. MN03-5084-2B]
MTDEADKSPEGLACRIVQDQLDLHRRHHTTAEHAAALTRADEQIMADLEAGLLNSATSATLRSAGVSTHQLFQLIQQHIVLDDWRDGRPFGGNHPDGVLANVFRQVAASWQDALKSATDAVSSTRQDLEKAAAAAADEARRLREDDETSLPDSFLPQDDYIGEQLAKSVSRGHGRLPAPRWLLEVDVLPGHDTAILPRIDFGERSVVLVPDEQTFSYRKVVETVRALVVDQMSRSAPSQLRITWLDPLEQGHSAGPLLDLIELNSHVLDGEVRSDPADIEAAVRRVGNRMTELEQRCLRGEFASLDAYNRETHESPEANHVVVVTGYPFGFTEQAARRLHRITENGRRLGVSVLVALDRRMAALFRLTDTAVPHYAAMVDGQAPGDAPEWWTTAMLPQGEYVVGGPNGPYACLFTPRTGEGVWVPCRFRIPDEAAARRIIYGYARASVELSHGGTSAHDLRQKRADPARRTAALRSAMIRSLHTGEGGRQVGDWAEFLSSNPAHLDGLPYTEAEVRQEAAYLRQQGYTHAVTEDGWTSPKLTAKGIDAALKGEHTLSDFISNSGGGAPMGTESTNNYFGPVFHADATGARLAWLNGSAQQNQTTVKQVQPGFENLADVVANVLRQLPGTGMGADDLADAEASASEILSEVVEPEPDRSRIRRALAALKGFLLPFAQQGALGAGEAIHDLAKKSLDQLQYVTF